MNDSFPILAMWSQSLSQRRHHRSEQVAGFSAFDMQITDQGSLQQRFGAEEPHRLQRRVGARCIRPPLEPYRRTEAGGT